MEAFERIRLPMTTTEAVLTELFHMVGDEPREVRAAWKLVRSGAIIIRPITNEELPRIDALMERYQDRPMDFADATLVHVAETERTTTVFTVDRADFQTYRLRGRKAFRILPELIVEPA